MLGSNQGSRCKENVKLVQLEVIYSLATLVEMPVHLYSWILEKRCLSTFGKSVPTQIVVFD